MLHETALLHAGAMIMISHQWAKGTAGIACGVAQTGGTRTHLCADEALFEVGVDGTGGLRRLGATTDLPALHLVIA